MRKLLLALSATIGTMVSAQTTGQTTLNVKLHPVMSITVNQPSVNIIVDTEEEYLDGAKTLINNHLSTFSTDGYKVTVKYLSSDLEPNAIGVKADGVNGVNYTGVNLTDVSQTIIDSQLGKGKKNHNVEYTVNSGLWDKASGDYITVIQYEITAR